MQMVIEMAKQNLSFSREMEMDIFYEGQHIAEKLAKEQVQKKETTKQKSKK